MKKLGLHIGLVILFVIVAAGVYWAVMPKETGTSATASVTTSAATSSATAAVTTPSASAPAAPGTCGYREVGPFQVEQPAGGEAWAVARTNKLDIKIGAPSSDGKLFDGPLVIDVRGPQEPCRNDDKSLSLISRVLLNASESKLLVETTSGSMTGLYVVGLPGCAIEKSVNAYTEGLRFSPDGVEFAAGCECDSAEQAKCACSGAQVFKYDAQCMPVLDEAASEEATFKQLNVRFKGQKNVTKPKTPEAKILE